MRVSRNIELNDSLRLYPFPVLAFPAPIQTGRPRAVSPDPRPSIEEVFTTRPPVAPKSTTVLSTLVVLDDEELSTVAPPPLKIVSQARVEELIFR